MSQLLLDYIRCLFESVAPVKSVEKVGSHEIVVSTFSLPGGRIVIWENSPYAQGSHSIYNFVVDESQRGLGIGSQLIDAVLTEYPGVSLSGQVSSLASLKVLFNKGFIPSGFQGQSFEELATLFQSEGGSMNMRRS